MMKQRRRSVLEQEASKCHLVHPSRLQKNNNNKEIGAQKMRWVELIK